MSLAQLAEAVATLTECVKRLEKAIKKPPRQAWTVRETADILGIPYDTVLALIHANRLGAILVGKPYVIPDAEIKRFLAEAVKNAA